jgi:hypothetical protein
MLELFSNVSGEQRPAWERIPSSRRKNLPEFERMVRIARSEAQNPARPLGRRRQSRASRASHSNWYQPVTVLGVMTDELKAEILASPRKQFLEKVVKRRAMTFLAFDPECLSAAADD